ncbi:MAG: epoxyqueuosine reductase [Armatimonadetes bacterium]|nr:epoxyqueuosine reductase [Armatimonadota bacterium]
MSFTQEMKAFAAQAGADLVGVAPVARYAGAPELFHPQRLLPQTKCVVCIAIRHLHGVLVPQNDRVELYPYQMFGYGWLSNIRLNMVAFEVARFLEDRGYLSCPYPSFHQGDNARLSLRHTAVVAGLATLGWNNLAITPKYGTKQRFVAVLTSAELEPDPMIEDDPCDRCMACANACPVGAIPRDEEIAYEIAGHPVRVAKLDKKKCNDCHLGKGGWFENQYPPFVTFTVAGHCGRCLINCPKGTYAPA